MTEGSLHYKDGVENNPWPKDVTASRTFRTLPAGKGAYNYRSKVLMGMAQTRVLNEPPSTTPKDAVTFSLPSITKPDTPEGIMMLSVLEMQSLLRSGEMTSMELTGIAFDMLELYDQEFNMVEVPGEAAPLTFAYPTDVRSLHRWPGALKGARPPVRGASRCRLHRGHLQVVHPRYPVRHQGHVRPGGPRHRVRLVGVPG